MTKIRFSAIVGAIALIAGSVGSAQAAVLTEDFEGQFPAWESNWFGTMSTARNYYCNGALDCDTRGNNPDGLWISDTSGGSGSSADVVFDAGFGASLTSLKLDVAGYQPTTLQAYDMANVLIFSQEVTLTHGAFTDPGVYATYTINSSNGISHFTFSGGAKGNTSLDNLEAVTGTPAVPEPETYAMMLAGLGLMGYIAKRRKA